MNIMLVEDDQNDILMVKRAFKKLSLTHNLIIKRHGEEALNYLNDIKDLEPEEELLKKPDLMFLDINMPCMGGHEFLKELRSHEVYSAVPVIILTSSRRDKDIEEAYRFGANSYIVKPIVFKDFLHIIALIDQYWSKNELVG